jgi:hypothetical protein
VRAMTKTRTIADAVLKKSNCIDTPTRAQGYQWNQPNSYHASYCFMSGNKTGKG